MFDTASLMMTLPELALSAGGLALLMVAAYAGDSSARMVGWLSVALLAVAAWLLCPAWTASGEAFDGLYRADAFGAFAKVLIYIAAAVSIIIAPRFFAGGQAIRAEYPILILFACVGMGLMVSAGDMLTLYVGLELNSLAAYVLVGVYVWTCVLESGVHATLAGTIVGLCVPLRSRGGAKLEDADSLSKRCIHALHPWVAFAIMPAFALANAGVSLKGLTIDHVTAPVTLGVALGLFLGKQVGVMAALVLARFAGGARLPDGANWAEAYGVAIITGIGFTMSLFIGSLAFADPAAIVEMRLGVIGGSALSGLTGLAVLWLVTRGKAAKLRA